MHRDEPADDVGRPAFAAGAAGFWVVELERLLEIAVLAVPSCIGVSVIVRGPPGPITHSALRVGWQDQPVLASLSVWLYRQPTEPAPAGRSELRLYAAHHGAFAETAPSLLALLDAHSGTVIVDAHLGAPDLAKEQADRTRWLVEQTIIGRAIGVLLDRGLPPAEGLAELSRLAARGDMTLADAARAVIPAWSDDAGTA